MITVRARFFVAIRRRAGCLDAVYAISRLTFALRRADADAIDERRAGRGRDAEIDERGAELSRCRKPAAADSRPADVVPRTMMPSVERATPPFQLEPCQRHIAGDARATTAFSRFAIISTRQHDASGRAIGRSLFLLGRHFGAIISPYNAICRERDSLPHLRARLDTSAFSHDSFCTYGAAMAQLDSYYFEDDCRRPRRRRALGGQPAPCHIIAITLCFRASKREMTISRPAEPASQKAMMLASEAAERKYLLQSIALISARRVRLGVIAMLEAATAGGRCFISSARFAQVL